MNKNYDFDIKDVIKQLVKVFKTKRDEATVGDLIAETGLPKFQIGQAIKVMMDEYFGGMKVTETGEIIYYFPEGMVNRVNGFSARLKRVVTAIKKATKITLSFLFKAWIVIMLAGYFIAFVILTILLITAAIAGMSASKNKGKSWSGRHSGGSLVRGVIEIVIQLLLYSSLSSTNRSQEKYPFYKAVFYYVFGEQNQNNQNEECEKKALIKYIQKHKGTLTIDEISLVTGKDYDHANKIMNKLLVEYEGEPEVTEDGTLYVSFPVLMQTTEDSDAPDSVSRKLISNDAISPKVKLAIVIMNWVNLVFGMFITIFSFIIIGTPETNPIGMAIGLLSEIGIHVDLSRNFIGIVLGLIPLTYSILFFAIRWVRLNNEKIENNEIKQKNFFRRIIASIFISPDKVDPEQIKPSDHREEPDDWPVFLKNSMDQYGEVKGIDFVATDDGKLIYIYRELKRELEDLTKFRKGIDVSQYAIGDTVYDSGS